MMRLGRLLGEGRVAEVFEAGSDVVKLYRQGIGPEQASREAEILDALRGTDLTIPRSRGVVEIDGRWGLVMTRLPGAPLGAAMRSSSELTPRIIETVADLHRQVNAQTSNGIPSLHARLAERITRAAELDVAERHDLIARLGALPDGQSLCHGDFHPFNILVDGERIGIIDWPDATIGPAVADVGRTYLLALCNMPDLAEIYLSARLDGADFDKADIDAWMPVLAAARLAENVPQEAERLLALAHRGTR